MFYEYCVLLIFPFSLIYAGISDALSLTIPNKVSMALIVGFILLVPFSGLSLADIGGHVLVGFLILLVGFVLFAIGGIGGGDVKLLAASGLWLGPEHVFGFLTLVAILGGILSLICLKLRGTPLPSYLAGQRWLVNLQVGDTAVPYGIAIGIAGLSVYPSSFWMGLS